MRGRIFLATDCFGGQLELVKSTASIQMRDVVDGELGGNNLAVQRIAFVGG